jgi:hypothetical protein
MDTLSVPKPTAQVRLHSQGKWRHCVSNMWPTNVLNESHEHRIRLNFYLHAEVGNAIALVRLVQHGKWRQRAAAAQYLGLDRGEHPPRFADAVSPGPSPVSRELSQAARLLDAAAESLSTSFRTGTLVSPGRIMEGRGVRMNVRFKMCGTVHPSAN